MDRLRSGAWWRDGFAAVAAVALVSWPVGLAAQARPVTLEEALDLARRNNPAYRAQANDAAVADWAVREAYGSFLPTLSLSSGVSYQAAGPLRLGSGAITGADLGITETPAYYSSRYGISFGLSLSGSDFFQLAEARSRRAAADAGIVAAAYQLEADVRRQYLAVVRARDAQAIAASALENAERALQLAETRHGLGAVSRIDVAQARIDRGRAEVGMLQAESAYETEKLRLLEIIGAPFSDFEPTSRFAVFEPVWTVDELTARALSGHPALLAVRAQESAAAAGARAAKMSYLPVISVGGGWSGFARKTGSDAYLIAQARGRAQQQRENCEEFNDLSSRLANPYPARDCSVYDFTTADEAAAVRANRGFPFDYETDPLSLSFSVSFQVLTGFSRERALQTARIAARDAAEHTRAEELRRRTEVATNLLALRTAYRTVMLEERNVTVAAEQLELAEQRYRLGAGSILELTQSQEQRTRADQAHLGAVYAFHEALAALEVAVGAPLAPSGS